MRKKKEIRKLKKQIKELREELVASNFRNEQALMKAVWVETRLDLFSEHSRYKSYQFPEKLAAEEENIPCSTEIKEKQDFSYNAWTGTRKVMRYGIELREGERYFSLNLIEYLGDIVNVLIEGKSISVFSRDGKRIDTFTRKDSET